MQNSFYTKWWFWFMIAVVAIVVVGGKNNNEGATTTPTEPKKEIKQEQPKQDVQQSASGFINPIKNIDKTAAMNAVKEKAKKDFPEDYMTQNYVADEQSKAFDYINGIN